MIASQQRKKYCCTPSDQHDLNSYYTQQVGGGGVFSGGRTQSGHGLSNFFGSLFRRAVPYLKKIGTQVLTSGARVASDMLGGQSFAESARARAREGIHEYIGDPPPTSEQSGSGFARGRHYKRKHTSRKRGRIASKKHRSSHKKQKRGDIFG